MSRLDDYQTALLAAHDAVSKAELVSVIDGRGEAFPQFVIDHGLGPLWHERTGLAQFDDSRMQAEALYLAQSVALREIGATLDSAGICHAVIKGAANRSQLYDNPAIRACHDLDILVRPEDRVTATKALMESGFVPQPDASSISRELMLIRGAANIDLHWDILREGRLRETSTEQLLQGRCRVGEMWVLGADESMFTLLVHSAFAKHVAGWELGLHRVADILCWVRSQKLDRSAVRSMLEADGVISAAWATLRWVDLLSGKYAPPMLYDLLAELEPGRLRKAWIDHWLQNNLPDRTVDARWIRLLGFSLFLHDTVGDALRAAVVGARAKQRSREDLAAFDELLG